MDGMSVLDVQHVEYLHSICANVAGNLMYAGASYPYVSDILFAYVTLNMRLQ